MEQVLPAHSYSLCGPLYEDSMNVNHMTVGHLYYTIVTKSSYDTILPPPPNETLHACK